MFSNNAVTRLSHCQVSKWREEKEDLLAAQAKQEAALQLEQQALREKEEEKRKKKAAKVKLKLHTYHKQQEVARAEEEVWLQRVREEREGVKREEALRGQDRVKYRKEQLLNKLSQQKKLAELKMQEEREREERLNALRQQVSYTIMLFNYLCMYYQRYKLM